MHALKPVGGRLKRAAVRFYLNRQRYAGRKLSFYVLSTGHCGTRFYSQVLNTASNARVIHEPPPRLTWHMRDASARYLADKEAYQQLTVQDYFTLEKKVLRQLSLPFEVYGDTLNQTFPFGLMLYRYLGPERIRLVHLVRNPLATCRSLLFYLIYARAEEDDQAGVPHKVRRVWGDQLVTGQTPVENVANLWKNINEIIQYQFALIDDPQVCKTIRLEDTGVEAIRELFDFLGLAGFDEATVRGMMEDRSQRVRNPHREKYTTRHDLTAEEQAAIARITAPMAARFGYDLGDAAPVTPQSRPDHPA